MIDPTTCPFNEQGFPAAHALGALDGAERREFEAHLAGCPICAPEVEALRATAAQLPLALDETAAAPPPALRARILDAVAAERADTGGNVRPLVRPASRRAATVGHIAAAPPAAPTPLPTRRRNLAAYAVAAVLLLGLGLGLLGWNVALQREVRQVTAERDAARAELAVYRIEAANGQASAQILYLPHRQQAILDARNLPPLGPGQVYQVWLIPEGGQPQGVGIFRDPSGVAAFGGDLSRYQGLAITIEPGYGSPAPTSDPVLAGTLQ